MTVGGARIGPQDGVDYVPAASSAPAPSGPDQAHWLVQHRLLPAWELLLASGRLEPELVPALRMLASRLPDQRARTLLDERVAASFRERGVNALMLKGGLLERELYPKASQRPRGDTDWLVAERDRTRAEACLAACGFARTGASDGKAQHTQDQWRAGPEAGEVFVDLHWRLSNHPALERVFGFSELWAARQRVRGCEGWGLGWVHALLHACMHYFGHHLGEFKPDLWLLDIDLLWRRLGEPQRGEAVVLAVDRGIAGLLLAGLERAAERFGTPLAPEHRAALEAAAARQWRTALAAPRGPLRELLLELRGFDSAAARVVFLRRLLLPSPRHMRAKYAGASALALPFLYVKRAVDGVRGARP